MQPRIEYRKVAPNAMSAMLGLEHYVRQSGLDPSLWELVKLRPSQTNGFAYCVDVHAKDARAQGESEQRLYAVVVWRQTPFFHGAGACCSGLDGSCHSGRFDNGSKRGTDSPSVSAPFPARISKRLRAAKAHQQAEGPPRRPVKNEITQGVTSGG